MFRHLFETVLQTCIDEGLVGGESFGVDASLIPANANQTRGIDSKEGFSSDLTARVIDEYPETLDDAAFGASTKVVPKYISPVYPAARRMIDRITERFDMTPDKLVGEPRFRGTVFFGQR
ncbi:hypothetical protein RUM8411_04355 [Ruegeria meonggei]|uniref:Transposase n=1 Tax=Ruegeria meonggei TaxID=1446476 RepID=A0A1X7ACZ1_9RHOB|nr:hypothetical protein RUM8411_04355 [Ruegeria meonggei]